MEINMDYLGLCRNDRTRMLLVCGLYNKKRWLFCQIRKILRIKIKCCSIITSLNVIGDGSYQQDKGVLSSALFAVVLID